MIYQLASLTLHTERLLIRSIKKTDLREIYHLHSNPQVNRYLPYQTWQNWDDVEHWYAYIAQRQKEGIAEQFVIMAADKVIGTCLAFDHHPDTRQVEFGYVLAEDHWGNGFMHEAMLAFVPAVRDTLDLAQLNVHVEKSNIASLRLLRKLGFVHTDTIIEDSGIERHRLTLSFKQ